MWYDWRDLLINRDASLREVITKMNDTGVQCVLVCDTNQKFLGLITDGDIRRSNYYTQSANVTANDVINKDCFFLTDNFTQSDADNYFLSTKNILIPIIKKGKIIDVIFNWKRVQFPQSNKTCALLMAGGFGTRLRPLTDECPKPMINIDHRPILEIQIEQLMKAGIRNFYISTHFHPEKIRSYFGNGEKLNVSITYVHEEVPLGTAGALCKLPQSAKLFENIIMMNGDILTNIQFNQLLLSHDQSDSGLTVGVKEVEHQIQFGVIEIDDDGKVINISEKPIKKYLVSSGIYVLSTKLIENLLCESKLDFPKIIEEKIRLREIVNTYNITEYWIDIGTMPDLQKARQDVYTYF